MDRPIKKIVVYTAMHKRTHISRLFCMSMQRLKKHYFGIYDIHVHAAISDQDSAKVCDEFCVTYTMVQNFPVGRKWNSGLAEILQKFEFDYVMIMGDDDIVSSDILHAYRNAINDRLDYFGLKELYFYDTSSKESLYFKYKHDTEKLIGCCRMISRNALEKTANQITVEANQNFNYLGVSFEKGQTKYLPLYQAKYLQAMRYVTMKGEHVVRLWDDNIDKGLDNSSEMTLLFNGFMPKVIETDTVMITDVKTVQNIWAFDVYRTIATTADSNVALSHLGEDERELVNNIK